MARLATQQYVPVFVGSTFVDLKDYRDAASAALNRLEMIVRGMELFGSKPGSPGEECLAVVRSCRVYIGIFGMRYGSIPDGYEKSMTHLEYEEAQRAKLPSLIYLIDELRQPVLPINIDTGDGAAKLALLKNELRKRHVISVFTTEQDLAARILADLPQALREIGAQVQGALPAIAAAPDTKAILHKFRLIPKRLAGTEVTISFTTEERFDAADSDRVEALSLELGDTVEAYVKLAEDEHYYRVYAEGAIAEQLLDLSPGVHIVANATTAFGVEEELEYYDDGTKIKSEVVTGLIIKSILEVKNVTPSTEAG
jgi:hypothetical protein